VSAPLADAAARDLIRTALDETLLVEAAAGTGKTSELVRRIVAVLTEGRARVEEIAAVTFTEKAAGELKLRLRAGLEEARNAWADDEVRRRRVEEALAHLEEAHVDTIHGFCADLLRERPVEARVDPRFEPLAEEEARDLYREAFERWLEERLADPPEGVRRALRRPVRPGESPVRRLADAGWDLASWRDFPAPWKRVPFDRAAAIGRLVEKVHALADLTGRCSDPGDLLYRDTEPVRVLSDRIRRTESVAPRDLDGLEAELCALPRRLRSSRDGRGAFYAPDLPRREVLAARDALLPELAAFAQDADADLAAALREELREVVEAYQALKARQGRLDFEDLLLCARDLLRNHRAVREDFQRRFARIFVDEFQDTDPLQAEVLLLLAAGDPAEDDWRRALPAPGKLFIVGDPKQSIYRFRRADVGIYQEVKERLLARGAWSVELTTSFRAVPSIQRFVNAAFAPHIAHNRRALQAGYVPLAPWREDAAGQPAIVALPVPRPYGKVRITRDAIRRSLPDAVGAFVAWLCGESGFTVTERDRPGERIPVRPRHVCLLFRQFQSFGEDLTRDYAHALDARGIPHLLVGGRSFHDREEVEALRTALAAVEWPDDELSVFATLHGSLFAVGDETLFAYRARFGRLHPFRIPEEMPPDLAPVGEALAVLRDLHRARNRRPVAETVARLLEVTRAHAGFVLRPSGEQVLANVLQVVEMARQYEVSGGLSFRGFVERLRDQAERREAPEAPILEEASEGVRLMTVHRAKGLEFPVVVLADLTSPLFHERPSRHLDPERGLCAIRLGEWLPRELLENEALEREREEAEGIRLAYVAATRARDLLVVPAVGDEPLEKSWLAPLSGALYPPLDRRRKPDPAPGCPPFTGSDTVLERTASLSDAQAVRAGLHSFEGYRVAWWAPGSLELGLSPSFGVRQEQLLGKEAPEGVVEVDRQSYLSWRSARDEVVARASLPSLTVRVATERARTWPDPAEVDVIEIDRDPERPSGPRYGSLVHAVLATAPLDASESVVRPIAEVQGRLLGATAEEVASAAKVVARALAHPILERARHADACRRETPVTLGEEDGLTEGVVDLAFREGEVWTVVDFKTDRELAESLPLYRRQVSLYAAAIAAATGQPARGVLLRV
jgi:ATP-dependent exoDNAse (exonuclease V) beta subunit